MKKTKSIKVKAIMPEDVIDAIANKKSIDQAIEEGLITEQENEKFAMIRKSLILKAVGLTEEMYQKIKDRVSEINKGKSPILQNDAEEAERLMAIAETQNKSNAKSIKEAVENVITKSWSVAMIALPFLTDILVQFPALKLITGAIGLGYVALKAKKTFNAKKGNYGDYLEKQKTADAFNMEFFKKLQDLEEIIEEDQVALMIKYRELSKNDFEDFMMIYMQMQLKKVGINCSLTNYSHSSMETADISKNDILTNFINNQKNRTSEVGLV